ncbi:Abortive infection C-terminus [Pseudomonas asturiensis]|uniref:Abortive infection C-terminus n=1 Tax=Pseudomonas asturiensis TaxID=1190415 RepID=A0A1M7PU07_9PSED|nr:abortive infection family protein [Pseudomonas asturiensis]SHN20865.1 Abortive infection C-terminus [Pseudomonas asturiensis]
MDKLPIPAYVLAAVADAVSETETHASLDSLFMYAEAPGDPPDGSKAVKALEWLRRINKECGDRSFSVVGRIIEKYMEPADPSPSFWQTEEAIVAQKTRVKRIRDSLARAGFTYSSGGILSFGQGLATKSLAELVKARNIEVIDFEFDRALKNVTASPREAVSAACNILETVFKIYIEEHTHLSMPAKQDLQAVWKVVKIDLGLDASLVEERDLQEIISGIMATVNGIGALRTHGSTAHGPVKRPYKLKPRHARLAVHAAHTIAAFVLETWDEQVSESAG